MEPDETIVSEMDFEELRKGINKGIEIAHNNAVDKGFWDGVGLSPKHILYERAAFLMLMVSELGEACEAQRKNITKSEHIPEFTGEEEELADCIIRILDYAGSYHLRLADAMIAKMQFNATRPRKHGKRY